MDAPEELEEEPEAAADEWEECLQASKKEQGRHDAVHTP